MRAVKYEVEVSCPLQWKLVALEKTQRRDVGCFPDKNKHYCQKDLCEDENVFMYGKMWKICSPPWCGHAMKKKMRWLTL